MGLKTSNKTSRGVKFKEPLRIDFGRVLDGSAETDGTGTVNLQTYLPEGHALSGNIPTLIVRPTITIDGSFATSHLLTASAYTPSGNFVGECTGSDWQIAEDITFDVPIIDDVDISNVTQYLVDFVRLRENKTYYARMRHRSGKVSSLWSPAIPLTMPAYDVRINKPTILTPVSGTMISTTDTLDFVITPFETLVTESFYLLKLQFSETEDFSSTIQYNINTLNEVTQNGEYTVGAGTLVGEKTYYMRARYEGVSTVSPYSNTVKFDTLHAADAIRELVVSEILRPQVPGMDEGIGGRIALSGDGSVMAVYKAYAADNTQIDIYDLSTTAVYRGTVDGGVASEYCSGLALNGDGTVLCVGLRRLDAGAGRVRTFGWDSGTSTWGTIIGDVTSPDPDPMAFFGDTVSMDDTGTVMVVGSSNFKSVQLRNKGKLEVFTRSPPGGWVYDAGTTNIYTIPQPNGTGIRLGCSVAISGDGNTIVAVTEYDAASNTLPQKQSILTLAKEGGHWVAKGNFMKFGGESDYRVSSAVSLNYDGTVAMVYTAQRNSGGSPHVTMLKRKEASGGQYMWFEEEYQLFGASSIIAKSEVRTMTTSGAAMSSDGSILAIGQTITEPTGSYTKKDGMISILR